MERYDKVIFLILVHNKTSECKFEIRLVSWNGDPPVLEKRQFIYDKGSREYRPGRVRGLTKDEFLNLIDHKKEILSAWKES